MMGEPAEICSHAETARRIAWLARIEDEAHGRRSMSVVKVIELVTVKISFLLDEGTSAG